MPALSKTIVALVSSFSHPLVAVILCIMFIPIIMHSMCAIRSTLGLSPSPSIPPFAFVIPMYSSTTASSWFDCLPTEYCNHGTTASSATLTYVQKLYASMLHSFGRHWKNTKPRTFSTLVCADQLCLFYGQMVVPFVEVSTSLGPSTIYTVRVGERYDQHSKGYYGAASEGGCAHEHPDAQIRFQPSKVTKKQTIRAKLTARQLNGEGVLPRVGTKTKKDEKNRRYGCPFSKHNPERYEGVYQRACTHPPGLEAKRIIEHLRRVHSIIPESKCKFCGRAWTPTEDDEQRLQELHQHFPGECSAQPASIRAQPEYMTRNQELVIRNFDRDVTRSTPDEHWVFLYMRLFPGARIPSPEYDYYTPTHRTTFSSRQRMATQDNCLFGVFTVQMDSRDQTSSLESDDATTDSLPRRHNSESIAGALSDSLDPHMSDSLFAAEPWSTMVENANANSFQTAQRIPMSRPSPSSHRRIQGSSPLNTMITTDQLPAPPALLPTALTTDSPGAFVYGNPPVPETPSDRPHDMVATATTTPMPLATTQLIPPILYQSPDELQEAQEMAAGTNGLYFGDNGFAQIALEIPQQEFPSQNTATATATATEGFRTPRGFQPQTSFQTAHENPGSQEHSFFAQQGQIDDDSISWPMGDDIWHQNDFGLFGNFDDALTETDPGGVAPDDTRGPGQ